MQPFLAVKVSFKVAHRNGKKNHLMSTVDSLSGLIQISRQTSLNFLHGSVSKKGKQIKMKEYIL